MNSKLNELYKYSDPEEVNRRADELYLPSPVHPSSRKDKKYMIFDGTRMVHFGQMGYEDATHHKNQKRIDNFRKRNRRWASAPNWTPAWLSYHLLW